MASDKQMPCLKVGVEIDPTIYPRVHALISKVQTKGRAEKLRQLASIGELVESGMLGNSHGSVAARLLEPGQLQSETGSVGEPEAASVAGDFEVYL